MGTPKDVISKLKLSAVEMKITKKRPITLCARVYVCEIPGVLFKRKSGGRALYFGL